jgi:membrane-associated protease RseP (regulator of RpoE activity)
MSLIVYDLILLGIFIIFVGIFLYKKRKELKTTGWLILYRTRWGIKAIKHVGEKYKKILKFLSYISVGLGYLLMAGIMYLVVKIVYLYITFPTIVKVIKVPPIMPLVPYFTELPGLKGIFPTFHFIDFIIAIIIVASVHEFSHGIFMRRYGIKIKSTGLAFLKYCPAVLGAFVEQDEKSMAKAKNFEQRAVLSAGTFANTLTAILFFIIIVIFFTSTFTPAGVVFDDYAYELVNISSITVINGIQVLNPSHERIAELAEDATFNNITADGKQYAGIKAFANEEQIVLYHDTPAIKQGIQNPIIEIEGNKIISLKDLRETLDKYSPGESINVKSKVEGEIQEYEIILGSNPDDPEEAWLGIGFLSQDSKGVTGKVYSALSSFKKPNIYYESETGEFGWFIYHLLWWIILINFAVALFNMLPLGGLDGGGFFYLTVFALTKSEKAAKKSFKLITYFLLLLAILLILFWAYGILF